MEWTILENTDMATAETRRSIDINIYLDKKNTGAESVWS